MYHLHYAQNSLNFVRVSKWYSRRMHMSFMRTQKHTHMIHIRIYTRTATCMRTRTCHMNATTVCRPRGLLIYIHTHIYTHMRVYAHNSTFTYSISVYRPRRTFAVSALNFSVWQRQLPLWPAASHRHTYTSIYVCMHVCMHVCIYCRLYGDIA